MIARSSAHQIKYYVLAVSEWVFTRAGSKAATPRDAAAVDESILENREVYDKAPAEPTSEDRVTA
jgi:hypothetical protein